MIAMYCYDVMQSERGATGGIMWTEADIDEVLDALRPVRSDSQTVEVKEAVGGLPTSLGETVSAFANGTGGLIMLGLAERDGFAPARGFRAESIAEALAQLCRDKIMPPQQPLIEVASYRGSNVVVAVIDEADPLAKPCYVRTRGRYSGSYIRTWDGDRRLSHYEIDRLLENRRQPTYDEEIVEQASVDDLLSELVQAILTRQRRQHPRIFGTLTDEEAMRALRITAIGADGLPHPTLAGLLACGSYPQRFMPRLNVTFSCYPGYDKAGVGGVKFLDNRSFDGPVPEILEDALAAVYRNTRVGGVLDGPGRKDTYEYPQDAVREAIVNAIMHRDYSPMSRGGQIQVNMYKDRLEILSIGGLYGSVTTETIDEPGVTSTRNQTLSRLLESTPFRTGVVAENRGTGFSLITTLLRDNGNGAPQIRNSLTSFSIVFRPADTARLPDSRRDPHYAGWGNRPAIDYGGFQTPSTIAPSSGGQGADRADPCVRHESGERTAATGPRTHATVVPFPRIGTPAKGYADTDDHDGDYSELERQLLAIVRERGVVQTPELVERLGAPRSTVTYQLRKLLGRGLIERTQPPRSPKQSYRLASGS